MSEEKQDDKQQSDEQQLLGAPYVLKWNGRNLKLGALEEGQVAELVALCKSNAIAEHDEFMALRYPGHELTQQQQQRRENDEERFELRMRSGYYQWGEKGMASWRATRAGAHALVSVLLESGGNPLTESEIIQLMMSQGTLLGRYLAAIVWDSEFPNVPRPEETPSPAGQ